METKEKIKAFLQRYFRTQELTDDDDFFSLGFVNSLFAIQLIMFIEQEYNVTVTNEDLDLNNFTSINAIVSFVDKKSA